MQLRSQEFKARAAASLANPHLRKALGNLRQRMVVGRVASVAELDNFEEIREAARRVRDDALANLDFLLEEFERNAIALLSNCGKPALDPPSGDWLGHHSDRERVRASGLWNQNHVEETCDPGFLDVLHRLVLDMRRPG